MSNRKKYKINENSLDEINNEEKAYFLGFFFADGHNSNRNDICITIKDEDKYILKEFLKILESNHPIKSKCIGRNKYSEFRITNKSLSNRLRELGINSNKTVGAKFPNYIEDNLIRHFIRGFMDGDGSIDANNPRVQFIGTFNMMKSLQLIIESETGIKGVVKEEDRSDKIYYFCIYGGKKCESFLDYLYSDSKIYLLRKFERYTLLKNRSKDGWLRRREAYGENGISIDSIADRIIDFIINDYEVEYNKYELLSMFLCENKLNKANISYHIKKVINVSRNICSIEIINKYGKIAVNRKGE